MELDWEEFKKKFPNLAREMENRVQTVNIGGVRTYDAEELDELKMPDAISYLRRCETEEQAIEVIDYLERKGEITKDYADTLRNQLKEKGVRSFGSLKKPDYYMRKYYYGNP
ncbi:DUF2095 family protein [Candidatus Bathyarchaeota archaeon]|nr:DUF2095 family protein [Candidatus Bathyarchaeota archaeon]MBS7618742.1 DUF2095 family protein [Candidatus Bathyarchaeota archaeon]